MNEQTRSYTPGGSNKPAAPMPKQAPGTPSPVTVKPIPGETAQETYHQVTPKEAAKEPVIPVPGKAHEKHPLRAAKGDDEVMSEQQHQAMPSVDEIKGKWKQQVGAAKIAWGKLTDDELLRSEGQEQKLVGLVQERYAITRDEADRQVKSFLEKNTH